MNTDKSDFVGRHHEISERVLKAYYAVYNELGTGFLESVYQAAMEAALEQDGLMVETQVQLPVFFRGKVIARFCADLIVQHRILVELKVVQALDRSHHKQVMNYLRATPLEVGFCSTLGQGQSSNDSYSTMRRRRSVFIRVNPWSVFRGR